MFCLVNNVAILVSFRTQSLDWRVRLAHGLSQCSFRVSRVIVKDVQFPSWEMNKFQFSVIIFRRTLSSDVFELATSTRCGLFAHLSSDIEQIWGQIVSLRVKTLSNTNLVVPKHFKKKKAYFWLTSVAAYTPY